MWLYIAPFDYYHLGNEDDNLGNGDHDNDDYDDDNDEVDEDGFRRNWWICDGCASSASAPAPNFDEDRHDDDNDDSMNGEYVDDNILWFH